MRHLLSPTAVGLLRRSLLAAVLVLAAVVGLAGPAGADPARPTNYRSEVLSVTPATDAVDVQVVGGDGFLQMQVQPGHEVEVEGYQNEPYLRFGADGTVQENQNSPATYLNESRFGTAEVPPRLQTDTLPEPEWRTVGTDGVHVWHDHRIHFMGQDPSTIDGLAEGEAVPWLVRFTVDGVATEATGSYRLLDAPSPVPWFALAAVAAVGVVLLGRMLGRDRSVVPLAAGAVLVAGAIGTVIGVQQNAAIPDGAGATPLTVILPAIALVTGALGLWRRVSPAGAVATLAGVAAAGGWVLTRMAVWSNAVLPTNLSFVLDRAGSALVLGLVVGAAVLVVRSGALAAPGEPDTAGAGEPEGPTASPTV